MHLSVVFWCRLLFGIDWRIWLCLTSQAWPIGIFQNFINVLDADHYTGMTDIFNEFDITGGFWCNGTDSWSQKVRYFRAVSQFMSLNTSNYLENPYSRIKVGISLVSLRSHQIWDTLEYTIMRGLLHGVLKLFMCTAGVNFSYLSSIMLYRCSSEWTSWW